MNKVNFSAKLQSGWVTADKLASDYVTEDADGTMQSKTHEEWEARLQGLYADLTTRYVEEDYNLPIVAENRANELVGPRIKPDDTVEYAVSPEGIGLLGAEPLKWKTVTQLMEETGLTRKALTNQMVKLQDTLLSDLRQQGKTQQQAEIEVQRYVKKAMQGNAMTWFISPLGEQAMPEDFKAPILQPGFRSTSDLVEESGIRVSKCVAKIKALKPVLKAKLVADGMESTEAEAAVEEHITQQRDPKSHKLTWAISETAHALWADHVGPPKIKKDEITVAGLRKERGGSISKWQEAIRKLHDELKNKYTKAGDTEDIAEQKASKVAGKRTNVTGKIVLAVKKTALDQLPEDSIAPKISDDRKTVPQVAKMLGGNNHKWRERIRGLYDELVEQHIADGVEPSEANELAEELAGKRKSARGMAGWTVSDEGLAMLKDRHNIRRRNVDTSVTVER